MKRLLTTLTILMFVASLSQIFAGVFTETFDNYDGMDPLETTANWNVDNSS